MRIFIYLLLLGYNVCMAAEWENEVNSKLDGLITQLNDGCSDEVKEARTLNRFKSGEGYLYAALISIEGQHCGNGNIEYLAVYDVGYERVTDEETVSRATYWLVGLAIVGGRGERFVDFKSLKFANRVFSMDAKTYKNDAMCCPSKPVILKYKLSFYGLSAVQPNPARSE
jgi:hypothetical protein